MIGTEPGQANVAADFVVQPTWVNGQDLGAQVGMSDTSTVFYLSVAEGSDPFTLTRVAVTPGETAHLRPQVTGPLAEHLSTEGPVQLRIGETRQLTVAYDCIAQGTVQLELTFEFEGLSPLLVPWQKTCGGEDNTALTITGGPTNEEVVQRGVPVWDESKSVGTSLGHTDFSVSTDPLSEQPPQAISTPRVSSRGACDAEVKESVEPGTVVSPAKPAKISVSYGCLHQGACVVTMEVPFHPDMAPYKPVRWEWTKMCGGTAIGVDVVAPATADGKLSYAALSADGSTNTTASWRVGDNVLKHEVWVLNDMARSLEYEVPVTLARVSCLDSLRCQASLPEGFPRRLESGKPTKLDIEYTCRSTGTSVVQLVLQTDGHDPFHVEWSKDCWNWWDSIAGVTINMLILAFIGACACVGCMKMTCKEEPLPPEDYPEAAAGVELDAPPYEQSRRYDQPAPYDGGEPQRAVSDPFLLYTPRSEPS
eukprot:gnl/TRDRNA2_/TRDRNA2_84707_c1_seq1.p1 gnl/TRDRNA2_/TRDRNA2_84707_c1~~gnl/TRDRNA2_/TRDRNA2_84707_c1_seq1.p1  ORF type:complete len:546 (-),score=84.70 gnl/TRDRNA2_/TRDRNA2_84707_c1_seq1:31-1467(-)